MALLVHLLTNGRYGYFRDELYYIACGQHLAFGYVDQPPLSDFASSIEPTVLWRFAFCDSLSPGVGGCGDVALTGMIAREIGGRQWAIALACAASLCALFNLAVGNFFSMNAFEPLFWMGRRLSARPDYQWRLTNALALVRRVVRTRAGKQTFHGVFRRRYSRCAVAHA